MIWKRELLNWTRQEHPPSPVYLILTIGTGGKMWRRRRRQSWRKFALTKGRRWRIRSQDEARNLACRSKRKPRRKLHYKRKTCPISIKVSLPGAAVATRLILPPRRPPRRPLKPPTRKTSPTICFRHMISTSRSI
uniref:Uncharacterized protein n=1 Tax=Cacopsylla melanoneura TaxID=428564 RepID=A0A8D9EK60_9HEMI